VIAGASVGIDAEALAHDARVYPSYRQSARPRWRRRIVDSLRPVVFAASASERNMRCPIGGREANGAGTSFQIRLHASVQTSAVRTRRNIRNRKFSGTWTSAQTRMSNAVVARLPLSFSNRSRQACARANCWAICQQECHRQQERHGQPGTWSWPGRRQALSRWRLVRHGTALLARPMVRLRRGSVLGSVAHRLCLDLRLTAGAGPR
jgi:hypothetical protein